MKNLQVDIKNALPFIDQDTFNTYEKLLVIQDEALKNKTGKGNDFLGWLDLPNSIAKKTLSDINETANVLRKKSEVIVVIGIGGSYLGAKAVIESLSGSFYQLESKRESPQIIFAGHNLSEDYHFELLEYLKDKQYSIIVISKSGTTTEPAIAFRILRKNLEEKVGKDEASKRIIAITDKSRGALRNLSNQETYKTFVIDDDIGGRYSVLTPVGLLAIACVGYSIEELIKGAKSMLKLSLNPDFNGNAVYQYTAIRHALYNKNKTTEILANYNPRLNFIAEWWKQLFGESDGKENKGIFPASVSYTTDLHSLGQYVQEGIRNIFETVLSVENTKYNLSIPSDKDNFDNLNYLEGKKIGHINKMAELGTMIAHVDGKVPNIRIIIPEISEFYIGQLLYFFEKSCALGGYLLGINPFDQPGVEAYKKNMFALLEKPGFEEETKNISERLQK